MAFKLTAAEKKEKGTVLDQLTANQETFSKTLTEQKEMLDQAKEAARLAEEEFNEIMAQAVEDFNATIVTANEFARSVAERVEGEMDGKSDKWLESDAGSDADAFKSAYADFEIEELLLEDVYEMTDDLPSELEKFDDLPDEAG